MIDPDYLLRMHHAELTDRDGTAGRPPQTFLRRAISSFYYALFHELCRQAADLLVGSTQRKQSRYAIVYRAVEHGRAKSEFKNRLQRAGLSSPCENLARSFVALQEARHRADYDPLARFSRSEAHSFFLDAEGAMHDLRARFPEKQDILTRIVLRDRN